MRDGAGQMAELLDYGESSPAAAARVVRELRERFAQGAPLGCPPMGAPPRAWDASCAPGDYPGPGARTPLSGVHPPARGWFVEALPAPDRFLTLRGTVAFGVTGAAQDSAPLPLEFGGGSGILIGWRGDALDLTAGGFAAGPLERASMGVRVFFNDASEELIVNGVGQDFAPMSTLFGDATTWSPFLRYVRTTDILNIQFRNFQNPGPGGHALRPFLTFAIRKDQYPGQWASFCRDGVPLPALPPPA